MKQQLFSLLMLSASLWADDITPSARIVVNEISINKSREVPGLVSPGGFQWQEKTPFTPGETAELWFEGKEMPTVSALRCSQASDRLADARLEYFDGREWKKGPALPVVKTDRGEEIKVDVKFSPAVRARALRLTVLKTRDYDHEVLKLGNWQIEGRTADKGRTFADVSLRLFTDAPFNTFDLPGKGIIRAELGNRSQEKRTLKAVMTFQTYFGAETGVPPSMRELTLQPGESRKLEFEFTGKEQGPCRANLAVYDAETQMPYDIKRIAFGMRDRQVFEHSAVAPLDKPGLPVKSWQARIAEKGTVWGADVTQGMGGGGRMPGDRIFRELKQAGATEVYCALAYHDFEPMPGVYHFAYFDHIVRAAARNGLDVTLGVWTWDFEDTSQQFLKDEILRDQNGKSGRGWANCFSPYSKKYRFHANRAMTALVKRYVNSPAVIGWHLHPYGMVDHDAHGIFDYHPDALAAYRDSLKKKYGTLSALNKQYQTQYKAWQEIMPPRPLWEKLIAEQKYDEASGVLDTRPVWVDYLEFQHSGPLSLRQEMMGIVRKYDKLRMICGMNASGGVGLADANYQALIEPDAFYGDQGLNGSEIIRRFVAKQRYKRPLRIEDISAVTLGRDGFPTRESLVYRSHWDVFQACVLGLEHYNYVFPTLDDSTFLKLAFANPNAKKLINEARESEFVPRKIGLLHSFVSDVLEGKYNYNGISLYRWWLMNGVSAAFYKPGSGFEIYSDGSPLDGFDSMKLILDDGSHILPPAMIDRLVNYVKNGGKLAMICGEAGRRIPGSNEEHLLLKKLGYTAFGKMKTATPGPDQLVFRMGNPVLRRTSGMPLHNWCELEAPEGGSVVGYVGAKPAAVTWKFGKGDVFLIGGRPGAITEAEVMKLFHDKKEKDAWVLWNNAVRNCTDLSRSLLRDLSEWAGEPELMSIADDVHGILRKKNNGKGYLAYIFNPEPTKTATLRLNLPAGKRWNVTALTLDGEKNLGTFRSETLAAPGLALPVLEKGRFLGIRFEPAGFWIF